MKYRVKHGDGKHRGGLLKLWTVGGDGDLTWRGRTARGYSDEMWRSKSGMWRIIRHADEPAITGSKECDDLFDDNSYVLHVSPFEAREWFTLAGISPPEVLLREIRALPFTRAELWYRLVFETHEISYTEAGEVVVPEELARRLLAAQDSDRESERDPQAVRISAIGDTVTDLRPRGIVRDGDGWRIWFDGKVSRIRNLVGIERIAELIRAAPASIPVRQLVQVGRGGVPVPELGKEVREDFLLSQSDLFAADREGSNYQRSRAETEKIQRALVGVDEDLSRARALNDIAEINRCEKLKRMIMAPLLPEAARRFADPECELHEADRKAVANSISSAIKALRECLPEMASYLKAHVRCTTPPRFIGEQEEWQIEV